MGRGKREGARGKGEGLSGVSYVGIVVKAGVPLKEKFNSHGDARKSSPVRWASQQYAKYESPWRGHHGEGG